jgi:hypothetical protein
MDAFRADKEAAGRAAYLASNATLRARAAAQYTPASTLEGLRAQFAAKLAPSTDAARNAADAFGDGDQRAVVALLPGTPGQDLIDAWACGMDFNPLEPCRAAEHSQLLCDAFFGRVVAVEAALAASRAAGGDALRRTLERRETMLRFTPLLACISGARREPPLAGEHDHARVLKALLAAGANANARDVAGFTPCMHVTINNTSARALAFLPLLIQHGADVNARNRAGRTALMEPTMGGRHDCVRALMAHGADPRIADNTGFASTALTGINPVAAALFSEYLSAEKRRARTAGEAQAGTLDAGAGALLGRAVRLQGLTGRPELNGRTGVACEWVADTQRYSVRLDACAGAGTAAEEAECVRVRVSNLVCDDAALSVGACASCGAGGAAKRCAACRAVFYCGSACQKAHWKAHKAPCGAAAAACVCVVPPRAPAAPLLPNHDHAAQRGAKSDAAPPPPGRAFTVKVQVPLVRVMREDASRAAAAALGLHNVADDASCAHPPDEIVIYNADRSVLAALPPGSDAFERLYAVVRAHGIGKVKAYLRATRDADGTLRVAHAELLPEQPW